MPKTINPVFKCSDDSEHSTAEAAEKHEAVLSAMSAFNRAAKDLNDSLGESALTADGKRLRMHAYMQEFYYIASKHYGAPHVVSVYLANYDARATMEYGSPKIQLSFRDKGEWKTIDVSDLYVSKKAAQKAAIELSKAAHARWGEEIEQMESNLSRV